MGQASIPKVCTFGTKLEHGAFGWRPSPFRTAWLGRLANCNEDPIGGQVLVLYHAVHWVSLDFGEDVNLNGKDQCHDNGGGYNLDICHFASFSIWLDYGGTPMKWQPFE
jgi:hypothetical protein